MLKVRHESVQGRSGGVDCKVPGRLVWNEELWKVSNVDFSPCCGLSSKEGRTNCQGTTNIIQSMGPLQAPTEGKLCSVCAVESAHHQSTMSAPSQRLAPKTCVHSPVHTRRHGTNESTWLVQMYVLNKNGPNGYMEGLEAEGCTTPTDPTHCNQMYQNQFSFIYLCIFLKGNQLLVQYMVLI